MGAQELEWVVEDSYCVGSLVQDFFRSFVKTIGLQSLARLQHKIPVNIFTSRVLVYDKSFIFFAHRASSGSWLFGLAFSI